MGFFGRRLTPPRLLQIFPGDAKAWKAAIERNAQLLKPDVDSVSANIVHQLESSLARRPFNTDEIAMYQASALSVRDHLISKWTDTQTFYTQARVKRVYYFSLEFLMGRLYDNNMLNLGLKAPYTDATRQLGFNIEDLIDSERDMGLGNGGLGRLAACYLDSSATLNLPCWGYSLRYANGIFKQVIDSEGNQVEVPDPWLDNANPSVDSDTFPGFARQLTEAFAFVQVGNRASRRGDRDQVPR